MHWEKKEKEKKNGTLIMVIGLQKNATLQGLHSTPTATVHSCRLQLGGMEGFEDVFALLANLRAFNRDVRVCVARDVCPPLLFSLSLFFFTEKILAQRLLSTSPARAPLR